MSPQVTGKLVFLFGLFVLVFTFKLRDHVPDLGRVAPDWWCLSHISEGQNNPILAFALCPCLVHALDTWKKRKKINFETFISAEVERQPQNFSSSHCFQLFTLLI